MTDLPLPDGAEVLALPLGIAQRAIYRLLYEHRDTPLTMQEIRDALAPELGEQEQLDRRRRDLNPYFHIEKVRRGRETAYRLAGVKSSARVDEGVSERDRAAVLRAGRCAMCGKTPLEDGVKLQVDHKIPREWGGSDDLENLQPLCEQCNRGKKNYFASFDDKADAIRNAMRHAEPHRRMGELLKAMRGEWVRGDIIEIVAQAQQYQEDWQKRLRELRTLRWEIEWKRQREGSRSRTYYRLVRDLPWPPGSIRAAIRAAERERADERRRNA
jgi:5-methylcytosine-specific restriction endonuclease McrA